MLTFKRIDLRTIIGRRILKGKEGMLALAARPPAADATYRYRAGYLTPAPGRSSVAPRESATKA